MMFTRKQCIECTLEDDQASMNLADVFFLYDFDSNCTSTGLSVIEETTLV